MTKENKRHDAVELTESEWSALLDVAERVGALSTTGPTAGQPSWRTLVRQIANGRLHVSVEPFDFRNPHTVPLGTSDEQRAMMRYKEKRNELEQKYDELRKIYQSLTDDVAAAAILERMGELQDEIKELETA